jgi:hypothetical protein
MRALSERVQSHCVMRNHLCLFTFHSTTMCSTTLTVTTSLSLSLSLTQCDSHSLATSIVDISIAKSLLSPVAGGNGLRNNANAPVAAHTKMPTLITMTPCTNRSRGPPSQTVRSRANLLREIFLYRSKISASSSGSNSSMPCEYRRIEYSRLRGAEQQPFAACFSR